MSPPRSPPPSSYTTGRRFERLAEVHLVACGYEIVARNVRAGREEIDLIVRRRRTVAFVEVKGRAGRGRGHPLEAIDHRKRSAVARVARAWIREHGRAGDRYRFDAVAVLPGPAGWEVEHVADAWRLE